MKKNDICNICKTQNNENERLEECSYCGELVCSENESCSEWFNDQSELACKKCISKWTKYNCNGCITSEDECPHERAYSYCYNCLEFTVGV